MTIGRLHFIAVSLVLAVAVASAAEPDPLPQPRPSLQGAASPEANGLLGGAWLTCHPADRLAEMPSLDLTIVVFRHHPGIIDEKERMKACASDAEVIRAMARDRCSGPIREEGGLGRGYELSIRAGDLARWKAGVDELLNAGKLHYYDGWRLNRHGYGIVPVK